MHAPWYSLKRAAMAEQLLIALHITAHGSQMAEEAVSNNKGQVAKEAISNNKDKSTLPMNNGNGRMSLLQPLT